MKVFGVNIQFPHFQMKLMHNLVMISFFQRLMKLTLLDNQSLVDLL